MRSIILCNGVSFAGTDEIYTNAIQERLERALSQLRSVVDISGDTISLK